MDNEPFIDDVPIKMLIFHSYVSHNPLVNIAKHGDLVHGFTH